VVRILLLYPTVSQAGAGFQIIPDQVVPAMPEAEVLAAAEVIAAAAEVVADLAVVVVAEAAAEEEDAKRTIPPHR
jgi:hypothetical protein